jgi:hypothetical protein
MSFLLLELDAMGTVTRQRSFGPPAGDGATAVLQASDGGMLVAGSSRLVPLSRPQYPRETDALVLKTEPDGTLPLPCPFAAETALPSAEHDAVAVLLGADAVATGELLRPWDFRLEEQAVLRADPCGCLAGAPPAEVSPPSAPAPLLFADPATLVWEPAAESGACLFDLYRGDLLSLRDGDLGGCLRGRFPESTARVEERPPSGGGWFFLVTGVNAQGEGPLGDDSRGAPRSGHAPCQ